MAGIHQIVDCLHLSPGERREGKALLNATLAALMQETAFAEYQWLASAQAGPLNAHARLCVSVQGPVVSLHGRVGSLSHRRLAEVIAWWVPGCCDVKNHLEVDPQEEESDDEICDAVRRVFDKELSLNAGDIGVVTRNREVTLHGVVRSEEQKRIAAYDCWYICDVNGVHNKLEVRAH